MSIIKPTSLSPRVAGHIRPVGPYTNTYRASAIWQYGEMINYQGEVNKWPIDIVRDDLFAYHNPNDTESYLEVYNSPGYFGPDEEGMTNLVNQRDFNTQVAGKGKVFGFAMRSGSSSTVGPQLNTDTSANNAKYFALDGLTDYGIAESPTNRAAYFPNSADTIKSITIMGFIKVTLNERGPFFRVGWFDNDGNDPVPGGADGWSIGIGGATGTNDPYGTAGNNVCGEFHGIANANFNTTTSWSSGWQMVTMVLNSSSQALLYKNTSQVNSTFTGYTPDYPTIYMNIGRAVGDEPGGDKRAVACGAGTFLFYGKALSLSEITQNYNALKGYYGLS